MGDPLPPEQSLSQKLAFELTDEERLLASNAWFIYLQLFHLAASPNPEQAESERRRLDVQKGRIGGIWEMILVSRGYKFHDWEIRLVDPPEGTDLLGQARGGWQLPPGANMWNVIIVPNPNPPKPI